MWVSEIANSSSFRQALKLCNLVPGPPPPPTTVADNELAGFNNVANILDEYIKRLWDGALALCHPMVALVQQRTFKLDWAYADDIPGSRCGPEDGPWPRPYQVLSDGEVVKELQALAKPQSVELADRRADSLNFQPSPSTRTQDRYVIKSLTVGGREWSLTGVFDGKPPPPHSSCFV
ncbi:hypothetical protein BDZ89DRAFT_120825 [Hymenopellis radicata]|nr:hypothetical protein BDZ89DRAFT_120825 [Hymenopellis radicata]